MHVQVSTLSKSGKLIEAFKLPLPANGLTVKSLIAASVIRKLDNKLPFIEGNFEIQEGLTLRQEKAVYFAYRAFQVKQLTIEVNQKRLLQLNERIPVMDGVDIKVKGLHIV
jgi:hypothetical protein